MTGNRTMNGVLGCLLLTLLTAAAWAAPAGGAPLSERIAEAAPGSVVKVAPGVYRANLHIGKALTLIGEPGAVLDGGGTGDVIRIAASDVTVRGFTVRNSGTNLTKMNAGIYIEQKTRNVEVADNRLEHVLFGIYLDGPSDVKVLNNRISGITSLRRPDRGDGIHLWNDKGVEVRGNEISGTRDGIYIYISPHNVIAGNVIHDVRYGIHYMYSNHDRLVDNRTYNTLAGYALMQSDHLQVVDNRSKHDASYGILLNYVTYSDFQGNLIRGVTGEKGVDGSIIPGGEGKGIFVYNSEFNRFHGNVVRNCPIGIHVTAGSDHNRVYGNGFIANRVQVKYVQNMQEEWSWHGEGNYWSDYLGWDMNRDGRGDAVYRPNDGVDVLLWKYPSARLLMSSPAILALRYVQRAFPVFTPPSLQDSHPLMKPPAITPASQGSRTYAKRH